MIDIVGTATQPLVLLAVLSAGACAGVVVGILSAFVRAAKSKVIWRAYELALPSVLMAIFLYVNYLMTDGVINLFPIAAYIASVVSMAVLADSVMDRLRIRIKKTKRGG